MYVHVKGPNGEVDLVEPEDCKRFHVLCAVPETALAAVADALGPWAVGATADHVWIRVDAVQAAAADRVAAGWSDEFAAMLGYARSKGWLNDAGDAIAAHVEFSV